MQEGIKQSKQIPFFMCPNDIYDCDLQIKDMKKDGIERSMNCYEKTILGYLIRCCNNSSAAYPSQVTISKRCGMSERQVRYSLENLIISKYITKKNRGNKTNKAYSNVYTINMELIS